MLEVRGQGCFLRFQSLLRAEVAGSRRVVRAAVSLWIPVMASAIKH